MRNDLFGPTAPLLRWLPDETLFSLASRHHVLWGHTFSWQSTVLMFGDRRRGTHHDFPSNLGDFVSRTHGVYGASHVLARDRTLLRFYRPFNSASDIAGAAEQMHGPSVAHLKFRLGLLTTRFRANHPLKTCPSCVAQDLKDYGWAYWRLDHQLPGVWLCPRHNEPLARSTVKSTGVERFLWHLPSEDRLLLDVSAMTADVICALSALAQMVIGIVHHTAPDGWCDPISVQHALRERLKERGWLTEQGNVRLRDAAPHFLAHCKALRHCPELQPLPLDIAGAQIQLGRLLRPMRSGTHPLRLLTAISWLFSSPAEYVRAHEKAAGMAVAPLDRRHDAKASDAVNERREMLSRMMKEGKSATAAAKDIGVDVATAMSWAAQLGISVRHRSKLLKEGRRSDLIAALGQGTDKAALTASFGVSVETVTRVLRTTPGLHSAWSKARWTSAQLKARAAWTCLTSEHDGVGVKLLRAMDPAAYAWLYRNDRSWLVEHTPTPGPRSRYAIKSGVEWEQRDIELSRAVRKTALELAETASGKQIRLWQVYQAVPELKAKLSALKRLPLTRVALLEATRRPKPSGNQRPLFGPDDS